MCVCLCLCVRAAACVCMSCVSSRLYRFELQLLLLAVPSVMLDGRKLSKHGASRSSVNSSANAGNDTGRSEPAGKLPTNIPLCIPSEEEVDIHVKEIKRTEDFAPLRPNPKRPLASETGSEEIQIDERLRFNDEADELLTLWQAPPAPPPDPRHIAIKESLREIKRARFAAETPKSVANESVYNEDIAVVRAMSSLLRQRDEALTKAQNIDGITSNYLFHTLVDPTDNDSFDEAFNYAHAMLDELISMDSQDLFYIGICCSPHRRFKGSDDLDCHYRGHEEKLRLMHLLVSCNGPLSARLEKALLATWGKHPRCTNKASGGGRRGPCDSVAFVYCCIGNLDCPQP